MEGDAQFTAGDMDAAILAYQEALQVDPNNAEVWAKLARIPTDEIAVANAQEMINICQQNLAATPTPELLPLATETSTPEALTPTPAQ